jgi:hypothetical protein
LVRWEDAENELKRLRASLAVLDEQVASLSRPAGLRGALGVLIYFSLAGVVFPLALMAWRPIPESGLVRFVVVVLFGSGLAALLLYIGSTIREARKMPESEEPGE